MIRKLKLAIVLISTTVFFISCAGRNFVMPEPESFTLNKTTYDEIINQFGKPYREGSVLKNEMNIKTISYAYASTGGSARFPDVTPARALGFYFYNRILVGHEFTSSYQEDSTFFPDSRVTHIKEGESTRDYVIQIMGRKYGRYVYPLIENENDETLVYLYQQTSGSAYNLKFSQKTLIISFDINGVVSKVDFITSMNNP